MTRSIALTGLPPRSRFSPVKYKFALMADDMGVVAKVMEEGVTPLIDSQVTHPLLDTRISFLLLLRT